MKKKLLIITIICVLIDQITKFLVVSNLDLDTGFNIIPSFFSITYVRNTGAAWGMFSNGTMILAILSTIFLYFAIKYIYEAKNITKLNAISYGLLVGGIIGNLIDRLLRNYVVDFLNFNIFGYNFPVFNIADTCRGMASMLRVIDSFVKEGK